MTEEKKKELNETELDEKQLDEVSGGRGGSRDGKDELYSHLKELEEANKQ